MTIIGSETIVIPHKTISITFLSELIVFTYPST